MTRMLGSLVSIFLCLTLVAGCSLFESDSDDFGTDKVDTESASTIDDLESGALNSDEEKDRDDFPESAEADNIANDSDEDEFADNSDDLGVDDPFAEDDLGSGEEALDDEFAEASLDGEEDLEISATDEGGIDDQLANDELDEFDDAEFGEEDEFALEEDPVVDVPGEESEPVVDVPGGVQATSFGNDVTNLEYKSFENGGTVVIETTMPANYQVFEEADKNQVVIQVDDVNLPERFKRPYITKDFKQDIATINAYSDPDSGSARFVIQMKRSMKPFVEKQGNSIMVMTTPGDGPAEPSLNQFVADNQMNVPQESNIQGQGGVQQSSGMQAKMSMRPQSPADAPVPNQNELDRLKETFASNDQNGEALMSGRFTGEKMSLDFKDTDVRTIIEIIADKSGVNLIMDEDVQGKTTMRLRDIPWDQALLVTLRSKGLGYVKQGNVLRIASQKKLAKEAQDVSAQIESEKKAKLLTGGIKVKYIPVSYAEVGDLSTKLKPFLSAKGKIANDVRTSSLVITDYGEYIERVLELVKALDTPPMQVEISAKLVEAREEFIRDAGINWGINNANFAFNNQTANLNVLSNGTVPTNSLFLDLQVGTFDVLGDLDAALGIYENQAKVKVLSQPRIITMNKTKASIKQTTQVPIETINPVGNIGIPNIQFQDLELSLGVTPQITFRGDVILDVELKREFTGNEAANGQLELNRRNAKTTIMVKNGKTAVLGGIYQINDRDVENGIPWLKDIPLIGYLFKQISVSNDKNELLLFIKPKILKEIDDATEMAKKAGASEEYNAFDEFDQDTGGEEPVVDVPEGDDDFDEADDFESELEEEGLTL